jgi:type VI secretion system secreted protein VgrG
MADSSGGSQQGRDIRLTTEVSGVSFFCLSMTATEYVGRPFVIELELLSQDFTLTLKNFLGKHMTAALDTTDDVVRYFDGIVTRFSYVTETRGLALYRATLRPWLWLLTRNVQSKVHYVQPDQAAAGGGKADENTAGTAPNIIKKLFSAASFNDVEYKLSRSYRVLDYCVQYQESDFAFVSRLMEQEGIYYYFKHESGKHTMVLVDASSAHDAFNSLKQISYSSGEHAGKRADAIHDWTVSQEIQSGKLTIRDYDLTAPNANLDKVKTMAQGHASDSYEIYEYPGHYIKPDDGEAYAGVHLEEQVARFERAAGRSNARWLVPGYLFTLQSSARSDQDRDYLVLETRSTVTAEFGGQARQAFATELVALPSTYTFRPARITPRPYIRGPQTAVVVGPSGEEIYTDKYGRVKVQFLWDRLGSKDENSSCWIRCAQPWAGKQWGTVFIPRIKQEVVVHFIEGDPDRPLITGAVYNGPDDQPSPITLPDNKTQSTIKTNSSTGGGGFNQIRFEDKKDSEELFVQAQKDMTLNVLNNRTVTITQDDVETVQKGKQSIEVSQGDRTVTVTQGKMTTTVSQDCTLTVQQGNHEITVSAGTSTITAAQSITLKVGSNKIVIDTQGVTIDALNVTITAQTAAKMSGATLDLEGSGQTTIKGGMVAIN